MVIDPKGINKRVYQKVDDFGVGPGGGGGGGGIDLDQGNIERRLGIRVRAQSKVHYGVTRLVVLVFAHPDDEAFKTQIVPYLSLWHVRSGNRVDFVCIGYQDAPQGFNQHLFSQSVDWMHDHSAFKFSGHADIVVLNAKIDYASGAFELDTGQIIQINLPKALEEVGIASASSFMEDIVRFTDKYEGDDPTWGFSDSKGVRSIGQALKAMLISLIPKPMRPAAKGAFHLRVRQT